MVIESIIFFGFIWFLCHRDEKKKKELEAKLSSESVANYMRGMSEIEQTNNAPYPVLFSPYNRVEEGDEIPIEWFMWSDL